MNPTKMRTDHADLRRAYEAEGADTERYGSDSFWDARYHVVRKSSVDRLLSGFVHPGDSFLDIGCGTGEYLSTARQLGASRTVGADLAISYLHRLRLQGSDNSLVQADGTALPFADESFDVVLCSEVIEHVPHSVAVDMVCELARVARRAICLTTPNRDAVIRRMARRVILDRVDRLDAEVGHINLLDRRALLELAGHVGFHVVAFETRHIAPPILGEALHLPVGLAPLIGHLETVANRLGSSAGNTMYAILTRST